MPSFIAEQASKNIIILQMPMALVFDCAKWREILNKKERKITLKSNSPYKSMV